MRWRNAGAAVPRQDVFSRDGIASAPARARIVLCSGRADLEWRPYLLGPANPLEQAVREIRAGAGLANGRRAFGLVRAHTASAQPADFRENMRRADPGSVPNGAPLDPVLFYRGRPRLFRE